MWVKENNVYTNNRGLIQKVCWQHTKIGFFVGVCSKASYDFDVLKGVFDSELMPFIKVDPDINWIDFKYTKESSIYFEKFLLNLAKFEPKINEIASKLIAEAKEAFLSPPAMVNIDITCQPLLLYRSERNAFGSGIRGSARIILSCEDINFNVSNTDISAFERASACYARK